MKAANALVFVGLTSFIYDSTLGAIEKFSNEILCCACDSTESLNRNSIRINLLALVLFNAHRANDVEFISFILFEFFLSSFAPYNTPLRFNGILFDFVCHHKRRL